MTLLMLPMLLLQAWAADSQALKIMFFGDSVISGVHNKNSEICPFRYEFLRLLHQTDKQLQVVGTNADPEGTCQKLGEELDVHNNGYINAGIDELLDFITADLQYLHNPVDYIFSSIGAEDCLQWTEGRDYQFLSQSIRRIMGRLLNINENAKIVHVPILLPATAGTVAVECMTTVNRKLHDVYSDLDKDTRIHVLNLTNYGADSFYMIFKDGENAKINQQPIVATTPVVAPPAVLVAPDTSAEPIVVPPTVVVSPKPLVAETQPAVVTPVALNPNAEAGAENQPRRLDVQVPVMFLPNQQLTQEIATVLLKALDWGFRAQTLQPTLAVTKPPDYYGYEWCQENYEDSVCFEYYYGYTWCLEKYDDDECYSYYYGDVTDWGKNESYKWCLNFYDEEYCEFAYLDEKSETWDWLSFGYNDCLKNHTVDDCSGLYYAYDSGDLSDRTPVIISDAADYGNGNVLLSLLISVALFGCLMWVTWKKFSCCKPKYSRLNPGDEGGDDEVELL